MDRSMLPGPSVMTNIWPMATMVEKLAKMSAAVARPDAACPLVNTTVASQAPTAAT